jgi:hypothetical protein
MTDGLEEIMFTVTNINKNLVFFILMIFLVYLNIFYQISVK